MIFLHRNIILFLKALKLSQKYAEDTLLVAAKNLRSLSY